MTLTTGRRSEFIAALRCYVGPIFAAAFVVVQLFDAASYPLFLYDEALLNDAGWQLIRTGQFRADVLSLHRGFEHRYLWQPPGLALSAAVSYALFGMGIVQTRLFSIVFGGLAVWAVYSLVYLVYRNRLAASLAATMLFFSPPWVLTAKTSRMDTGAILAMLVATYIAFDYLLANSRKLTQLFLSGLVVGVAALFHSAALPWGMGLGAVVLIFHHERVRSAAVFSIGVALPLAAWIGYALQTPKEFELQYLALLLNRTEAPGILDRVRGEAARYFFEFSRLPTVLLVLGSAIYGLVRHRLWLKQSVAMLLILATIVVILHALVAGKISGFYTLYPLTLIYCALGIGVAATLSHDRGRPIAIASLASVVLFVSNSAMLSLGPRLLALWYQSTQRDYALQLSPLSTLVKPGDVVFGDAVPWIAIMKSGGRLQSSHWVPNGGLLRPDPHLHKYVVVRRGETFPGMEDYRKELELGQQLPIILGSSFADRAYTFDLWRSKLF